MAAGRKARTDKRSCGSRYAGAVQRSAAAGARVIYDSNFNSLKSAVAKVGLALEAKCKVKVIFVHGNPEAHLEGVLPRAIEQGRTLIGHLCLHYARHDGKI
jgi:hypothetical protein